MHPSQLDLSELPCLLGKCMLRDQNVEVPAELRRLVVDAIAAEFPSETVDEIPLVGKAPASLGFLQLLLAASVDAH